MAEAELRRRDEQGASVPWTLVNDNESPTGLAEPTKDALVRERLLEVVQALGGMLDVAVSNDPASIALQAATDTLTEAAPLTVAPALGNAIRLWWVSVIPDPDNAATGSARVALGASEVYRSPALAHRQRFDGGVDEALTVTIVGDGAFDVTVHYEEYTP